MATPKVDPQAIVVGSAPALDADNTIQLMAAAMSDDVDLLRQGKVPLFESPKALVQHYATNAGIPAVEDFSAEMRRGGYDPDEAVRRVGLGGELSGDYYRDATKRLEEVKGRQLDLDQDAPLRLQRDKIAAKIEEKGVKVSSKVAAFLGKDLELDSKKDFVTAPDVGVVASPDGAGFLAGSGFFNQGEMSKGERRISTGTEDAVKLSKLLMEGDPGIARDIEKYGNEVNGARQYGLNRMRTLAEYAGHAPGTATYEAFVTDPKNRRRAIAEVSLLKIAGLWTAPIFVSPDYLYGDEGDPNDDNFLWKAAKTALRPTIEVVGVTGKGAPDRLILRQGSGLRTAMDIVDIPQQVISGVLRHEKDIGAGRLASNWAPGVLPYRLLTDEGLQDQVLASLGTKDNFFDVALESEVARSSTTGAIAAGSLGFFASIFFPDLTGLVGVVAKVADGVTTLRKARRVVDTLGEVEKAAKNIARVDALEAAVFAADTPLARDLDTAKSAVARALYEDGPKGRRVAIMGPEAQEVADLLPRVGAISGEIESPRKVGGKALYLKDMAVRQPHLDPSLRRTRTASSAGVSIVRPEAYNLARRRAEFDTLDVFIDQGDVRVLAPQLLEGEKAAVDALADVFDDIVGANKFKNRLMFSDRIGVAMLDDVDEFKAMVLKQAGGVTLDAAALKRLDDAAETFATQARKWHTDQGAAATTKLRDAVNKGRAAVALAHEARMTTLVTLRQAVAKSHGIRAIVHAPQILKGAAKLPDFSPSARVYRERLLEQGLSDVHADAITAMFDLRARNWARSKGRDATEWWDSRVGPVEPATPAPLPPGGTTPPPTPAPGAPTPGASGAGPATPPTPTPPTPAPPAPTPPPVAPPAPPAPKPPAAPPAAPPAPVPAPKPALAPKPLPPVAGLTDVPPYTDPPPTTAASKKKINALAFNQYGMSANKPYADETRDPLTLLTYINDFATYGSKTPNLEGGYQLATWLSKHGTSPSTRAIMTRILPFISKDAIAVRPFAPKGLNAPANFNAKYRVSNANAYVNRSAYPSRYNPSEMGINAYGGLSESTIVHEFLHLATMGALQTVADGLATPGVLKVSKEITGMVDVVTDYARIRQTALLKIKDGSKFSNYAPQLTGDERRELLEVSYVLKKSVLGSLDTTSRQTEFISHVLAGGPVVDFMRRMPAGPRADQTMFSKFVALLVRLFNDGDKVPRSDLTVFEQSINLSGQFLDEVERALGAPVSLIVRQSTDPRRVTSILPRLPDGDEVPKALRASRVGVDPGSVDEVEAAAKAYLELGTESPYFKRWFGESKVVGEAGEPLVVYHGTSADFDEFKPGFNWVATKAELANEYADIRDYKTQGGGNILPLYVKIEHPFDADRLTGSFTPSSFVAEVLKQVEDVSALRPRKQEFAALRQRIVDGRVGVWGSAGLVPRNSYWLEPARFFGDDGAAAIRELFALAGFDGLRLTEGGADTFAVLDPAQVKSVYNRGTFDDSARILRSAPAPVAPPSAPVLKIMEDGRALLKGFENAEPTDVIREVTKLLIRDLDPADLDIMVDYLRNVGVNVKRSGADLTGLPADVAKAQGLLGDAVANFTLKGELPEGSEGMRSAFQAIKDDIVSAYRAASKSGAPIPPEVVSVFEPILRASPADTESLPAVLAMIRNKILGSPPDRVVRASGFLDSVVKEASRQGTDVTLAELKQSIDDGIAAGDRERVVLRTKRPLFPGLAREPDPVDDLFEYTLADIADAGRIHAEVPQANLSLDTTFRHPVLSGARSRSAVESLYAFTRTEVDASRLAAARTKLVDQFGLDVADKIITKGDILEARLLGNAFSKNLAKLAVFATFGGDATADLAGLPEHVKGSVLAGVRNVEQSTGDTIRLTTEIYAAKKGPAREAARDALYSYLSGGLATFARGGRPALSSGADKFGDLAQEVQQYILRSGALDESEIALLNKFAQDVSASRTSTAVISPVGKITQGYPVDPAMFKVLSKLFRAGSNNGMQFLSDFNTSLVHGVEPNVIAVASQQAYEALLYHMGVTKRYGKYVMQSEVSGIVGPGGSSFDRSKAFLLEVENARQGGKTKRMFGGQTSESAVARVGVLLGAHGAAARTRQLWTDMGVYIDGSTYRAFSNWSQGMGVDPAVLPQVERVARMFGFNPNFFKDPVLDANFFIPRAARERLTEALARGLVKEPSLRDILGTEDNLSGMFSVYYRFLKIQMVRGAFVIKQRYFFMNTLDHFNQLAVTVGFGPALASVSRVVAQDFAVLPGVTPILALLAKRDPSAPEKLRKALQRLGDRAAQVVGSLVANSKWKVGVNEVLNGAPGFIRLGNDLHSYANLRRIAVEEGIFSSFDTSALKKSLAVAEAERKGSRITYGLADQVSDWRTHLDDTAEAWSERERVGAMVTLIEMGSDPRSAARATIEALYDYAGSMSKGDRQIWINLLQPFWAFQKNANAQLVNNLFSPTGAYRMSILRRAQDRFADAATQILYNVMVDDYGISESSLPPELRGTYSAFKMQWEYGFGPLDPVNGKSGISPATRAMLTRSFGDLSKLSPETRQFLENGYGGPENVPEALRQHLRLLVSGTPSMQRLRVEDLGSQVEFGADAARLLQGSDMLRELSNYAVQKPHASARRGFNRDKAGIAVPLAPTPEARMYMRLIEQMQPDHPYLELYLPETSIHGGMRHVAAIAALLVLAGETAVSSAVAAGAGLTGVDVNVVDGGARVRAFQNILKDVADIERAPLLSPALAVVTGATSAPPIRVHPTLAKLFQERLGLSLLKLNGSTDIYAAMAAGSMTVEEADALLTRTAATGEVPIVTRPEVDDPRVQPLQARYTAATPALMQRVVDVADALSMDPEHLAHAIQVESGFDPAVRNGMGSSATGLIQFMGSTARRMGTTTDALAAMSAVDQMEYVYRYLAPYSGRLNSYEDVAMAIYYPVAIGRPDSFDIANDVYNRALARARRRGRTEADAFTDAAEKRHVYLTQNPGLRTKGDYLAMAARAARVRGAASAASRPVRVENLEESDAPLEAPARRLPSRGTAGRLTEDRYYMLPGAYQVYFQLLGLAELNRMFMQEVPIARTPLEQAGVGDSGIQTGLGTIAYPTTRTGIILWAKTFLGTQTAEVSSSTSARADDPGFVSHTKNIRK